MKKEWSKPKLIRLYSGKPEESVLVVCKTDGDPSGSIGVNCEGSGVQCTYAGS
jgi:hypothetical protein